MLSSWRQPAADRYPRFGYAPSGRSVKSRSHDSIPVTWSGGTQLIASAPTPISSKRRAARPNASPSGPPQCSPYTPHTPCRQRRKLSHTGRPVSSSASTVAYVELRTSDSVSTRIRSGWSSSNARASSRIVSRPSGVSTSPLMLNATATSSSRPASRAAVRARRTARRATSIQCTGSDGSISSTPPRRSAVGRPHVFVEITSHPVST